MKKFFVLFLVCVLALGSVFAAGSKEGTTETADGSYPAGDVLIWMTGQPQFKQAFYDGFMERNADKVEGVKISVETLSTMADGQQKISMYKMAGDEESLPDVIYLDAVGIVEMADAGMLRDLTSFYAPQADRYLEGAANDATVDGKVYGLPDSVRPQLLFYNAEIFEKYDVDPNMMSTMEGYLEAGRLLKERSNGEVYLSWVDTSSYTWRYWFRRGMMPQANARIWDENGNVVIGSDEGAKRAFSFFDTLYQEGLLYKTAMMKQPIYEATDDGKIATFYIGAFWDEFLRKNLTQTAGKWRVMSAPVFEEVGTAGAPVSSFLCIVDTGTNEYEKLAEELWYDAQNNAPAIEAWVTEMERINGAYCNPVSKEVLASDFWQMPSEFYGGQSFRKAESDGLLNPSKNLTVTPQDSEADSIISAEVEKYVAGEQDMNTAIANMQKELELKIGKADV